MSVKEKHNFYNKNTPVNEITLCDYFCKLTINDNINIKRCCNNSSLDSIQDSTTYISDYISISSDISNDNNSYMQYQKSVECETYEKIIYSKTNYKSFSIYNWNGLINYLISRESYQNK